MLLLIPQRYNFSSKSQLSIMLLIKLARCCWYHKGTIFQANHNLYSVVLMLHFVVVDTTKVQFFKQITTILHSDMFLRSCCWYHKGTIFQANHNKNPRGYPVRIVVVDTTKVQFFKQITTKRNTCSKHIMLLLIPQRYNFSSKSQLIIDYVL